MALFNLVLSSFSPKYHAKINNIKKKYMFFFIINQFIFDIIVSAMTY